MARVHILRGQDRVFGFTLDEHGTNLPRQCGPWTTFKTVELYHDEPYQGVDVGVCLDDISKHGFYLTAAHKRITDIAVPAGKKRALVLSGGGSAGNAWLIGVIAGLLDGGLDVTEADLIIGTSAGSTAAAQITSATPTQLFAEIVFAAPQQRSGPDVCDGGRVSVRPLPDHMERTSRIIAAAADAADMRRRMGAAALEMDKAPDGSGQTQRRATVAARLPSQHWPQRSMLITAVDARTGEPVVLDRHSGVDLVDAVAASTASGLPYSIGENRYIDGGYRRNENADLAAGYERVLVLSPFGGRTRHPLEWGMQLAAQVDELRAGGSRVETIFPGRDARNAFGDDMMNLSTRPPAARAGYNQGRDLAEQLTAFWR